MEHQHRSVLISRRNNHLTSISDCIQTDPDGHLSFPRLHGINSMLLLMYDDHEPDTRLINSSCILIFVTTGGLSLYESIQR